MQLHYDELFVTILLSWCNASSISYGMGWLQHISSGFESVQVEALRRRMEITVRVAWLLWQDISRDSWQGFMYRIWSFWMTLIWISDMATLFHQLQFFQKVHCQQNGKQTHPRKDILSPVDERSRQLTSNSSLMGLESQCTNASKSTWHLFSPISLAFLQTCQVSNV